MTDFLSDGLELTESQKKDISKGKVGRPKGSVKDEDQKKKVLIQFKVSEEEAEILDRGMNRDGCASRSHFCRKAVNELLDRLGVY